MKVMCAIVVALTLVGCGAPKVAEPGLKRLARPEVAAGWKVVKAKGANFSIALPNDWEATEIDFSALPTFSGIQAAPAVNFSPTSLLSAKPKRKTKVPPVGMFATGPVASTGFGTVMVTVEARDGKESARDVAERELAIFEDMPLFAVENAKLKDYTLPIGPTCRAQYTMKFADVAMVTKSYYLVDGDLVYNVSFLQAGNADSRSMPTKEIMATFRVAKAP